MDWDRTCALCQISGKARTTGPLSTRDNLTVHENCLLYSSGLFCQNSPVEDDLFGFSVEDIKEEIIRGNKLICHLCKQKGATVGCELKRCKKSYHFPCAMKDNAKKVEDIVKGTYTVYCDKHCSEIGSSGKARKLSSSKAERRSSLNGDPDKGEISTMRKKGITKDNAENVTLTSQKKKPKSLNGTVSDGAVARPSSHASDSDTHRKHSSTKKPRIPYKEQEVTPSCPQTTDSAKKKRRIVESSDSDGDDTVDMECAPLDTDFDDSGQSQHRVSEPQHKDKDTKTPEAFTSECHSPPQNEDSDVETLVDSDAGSHSLLLPVTVVPLSDDSGSLASHLDAIAAIAVSSCHTLAPSTPGGCRDPAPTPPPPSANGSFPAGGEADVDAALFWRSCTQAGCTEAIFDSFIADMTGRSKRILTDQASQEDYDVSLKVLQASGQLTKLLSQQGKERERKLKEASDSLAAVQKAWSILKE